MGVIFCSFLVILRILEDNPAVVTKFYRPERWSDEAILEEHKFTQDLASAEIPVVPPMSFSESSDTLFTHNDFRFAVYPNCGGRWPELDNPDNLIWIGRFVGRIHAMGLVQDFKHRPTVDIKSYGREPIDYLKQQKIIPAEIHEAYFTIAHQVLDKVESKLLHFRVVNQKTGAIYLHFIPN